MEVHPVNQSIAIVPVALMVMLFLGGLLAAGALWATRRKRKPGSIVGILAGGAVASVVFLMTFGYISASKVRHAQVEQHRAELSHRLHAIGAELHEQEVNRQGALEAIPIADRSVPVEAARPSADIDAVAGADERLAKLAITTPLPDWALTPVSTEDDRNLVVVQSEQFADPATAAAEALGEATELVRRNFDEFNRLGHSSWSLDPQTVRSAAVRRTFTESINRTAGEHDFTVYRTYLLVELSPNVRNQIEPIWREQVTQGRSLAVMVLIVLATAFAGVVAGYFRLDERTGGKHRWALSAGSMAMLLLIVAGVGVAGTRATRMIRSASPEATDPARHLAPPVRVIDDEMRVDDQKKERFVEVADRMVQAINAADYEGMRKEFNETMLEKFPVEKCREFFDERIADKYGKLTELEPPEVRSPAVAVFVARCERGTLDFTLVLDDKGQVAGMLFKPRLAMPMHEPAGNGVDCSTLVRRG